jgi:uncharacterized membrane protein YcaP (DUF421 family)
MDSVLKAAFIYLLLLVVIRLSGRRTLGEMTAFDLVLFLIIGGATQRALIGQDYSLTNAVIVIATFLTIEVALTFAQRDVPTLRRILHGIPTIVVERGNVLHDRLRRARITIDDVMAAARLTHGIERLDQIKFAILEANGKISIIPSDGDERSDQGRDAGGRGEMRRP